MTEKSWREQLIEYLRQNARPEDKFSHQPRLYRLAQVVGEGVDYDDDVVFAAAWLHDLGVFIGHRPEDPEALARWDHVAYTVKATPALLRGFGFPAGKIDAVLDCIRGHLPASDPVRLEAVILRDADILEQLGAVGILRIVSKVGRDTRFVRFSDALRVLRGNLESLPGRLRLESARVLAAPRTRSLAAFLDSAEADQMGTEW